MTITQYNGYWISTDTYLSQPEKDDNARLIWDYFVAAGWTQECIAGMLGNMDVESSINPAIIEGRNVHNLITNAQAINQISNSTGVGIVQWTGYTDTPPVGNKLVSFAIRRNMDWYDGALQCLRLDTESNNDLQFVPRTIDGVYYDFQIYIHSHESPEQLAKVFQLCYENGGSDTQTRQERARYYYDMLRKVPVWLLKMLVNTRKELKPRCQEI